MQFGRLKHRVTIQNYAETTDSHRHVIREYKDLVTVRADVRGLFGTEGEYAERIESRSQYRIVIRYRSDVTPQMRLIWIKDCNNPTTLEIMSALDMRGDRRMLTMVAIEVTT